MQRYYEYRLRSKLLDWLTHDHTQQPASATEPSTPSPALSPPMRLGKGDSSLKKLNKSGACTGGEVENVFSEHEPNPPPLRNRRAPPP